jgi:hypothetical protein
LDQRPVYILTGKSLARAPSKTKQMKIRSERDSEIEKSKPTGNSGHWQSHLRGTAAKEKILEMAMTRGKPSRRPATYGDGEAKNEDKQRQE